MCTRAMHTDTNKTVTGRNFDWKDWSEASLWIYPKGLKRYGAAGDYPHEWTSEYKSVTVASYGSATNDGMNDQGLVANLLWLSTSIYPKLGAYPKKKAICVSAWAQYILDTCKDVREAVNSMQNVYVVSTNVPDPDPKNPPHSANCHLSVSDKAGNSAIFEYVNGQLFIYTNLKEEEKEPLLLGDNILKNEELPKLRVMTNEPVFSEQLKLYAAWEVENKNGFLPGTCSPVDRFIRATYYNKRLPESKTSAETLAHVLSVMHNVVEPFEVKTSKDQTIIPTQYVTLSDHEKCHYFFGPARSPFISWIDLNSIVFTPEQLNHHMALSITFKDEGALMDGEDQPSGGQLTRTKFHTSYPFLFREAEPQAVMA